MGTLEDRRSVGWSGRETKRRGSEKLALLGLKSVLRSARARREGARGRWAWRQGAWRGVGVAAGGRPAGRPGAGRGAGGKRETARQGALENQPCGGGEVRTGGGQALWLG